MVFFYYSLTPIIEICIIAIGINYLLSFLWNTRSINLVKGVLIFTSLLIIFTYLKLPVLHKVMIQLGSVSVISLIVLFQPELRSILLKLNFKVKSYREISHFESFLDQITNSIYKLADKRIGALIILENENSLNEYIQKGILINGEFSSELLETIFTTTTPLHDGATIIRDKTIVAASCILPLSEDNYQFTKSMGTRHRAGVGLSAISDSLIIIISEETGKVSIARDNNITSGIMIEKFKGILKSFYIPPASDFENKFKFIKWLKQW